MKIIKTFFILFFIFCNFVFCKFGFSQELVQDGKKVKFEYTLKVEGEEVESTIGKDPLEYTHGQGQIIPGLEKELEGMRVSEEKTVVVEPKDAYGQSNAEAIKTFPRSSFPQDIKLEKGLVLELRDPQQGPIPAIVSNVTDTEVELDFNHPLSGKELEFHVTIVGIE